MDDVVDDEVGVGVLDVVVDGAGVEVVVVDAAGAEVVVVLGATLPDPGTSRPAARSGSGPNRPA